VTVPKTLRALAQLGVLLGLFAGAPEAHGQQGSKPGESATESTLTPNDFAWGVQLTARPGQALQTFLLPQAVLERCDAARTQLAVFNAAGELVPHAVRQLVTTSPPHTEYVEIPAFPIYGPRGAEPQPPLRVQVQRRADGTLTTVSVEAPTPQPADSPSVTSPAPLGALTAYILDTSRVDRGIESLRFELAGHEGAFVWPLVVETSTDLARFESTPLRGSLVSLEHGDHTLERRELEMRGLRAPYLRLTWPSGSAPARIARVSAALASDVPAAPLDVREIQGATAPLALNERDFDLGAALPLHALELVLEKNSVLHAELFGSPDLQAPFEALGSGQFYHLEHDTEVLRNERAAVPRGHYRRIRVRVAAKGGGLGSSSLNLRVYTIPEQVLFIARGEGPFQLAFGRAGAPPAAFDPAELTALIGASPSTLARSTAEAGPLVQLGGEAALVAPTQVNWKKPALWAVLLVAVGLLGALSIRLLRGVNRSTGAE
jgi:Protein of unknown function (DUF3999)